MFKNLDAYNTRVFKDGNTFEIRFASILTDSDTEGNEFMKTIDSQELNGYKFVLSRGDYSPILKKVNKYLTEAQNRVLNETQNQMISHYIQHFLTGNVNHHKDGSRYWIKDKGPIVETYIGFIENYRDPAGMRAEFEGRNKII